MEISNNLRKIRSKINATEKKYQREKNAVCLIAVSKTRKIEEIISARLIDTIIAFRESKYHCPRHVVEQSKS